MILENSREDITNPDLFRDGDNPILRLMSADENPEQDWKIKVANSIRDNLGEGIFALP